MEALDRMPYQTVTSVPMADPRDNVTMAEDTRGRRYPAGATIDVWHAPDGWPLRRIRVAPRGSGGRGSLLFLSGRADPFEKYVESLDHWAERGWNVESFDWRGQGGSGRNPAGTAWDFGRWTDDLRAYGAQWMASSPGPHGVVAHSMGGFLALDTMMRGAFRPDAAVLVAPMLGLRSGMMSDAMAGAIARRLTGWGWGDRPVWAKAEGAGMAPSAHQRRLTHDLRRYADRRWWRVDMPELASGAPTWGWLSAAYAAMASLEASSALAEMAVPLLILAAGADRLVSIDAIRAIVARLPDARLHVYGPEVAHEILREVDAVRDDALARIDAFFDERAPHP